MRNEHEIGVRFPSYVKNEDHTGVRYTRKANSGQVQTIKCVVWNVQGNSFYLVDALYWLTPLIDYELQCTVNKQIIHNCTKKQRKGIDLKGGVIKSTAQF